MLMESLLRTATSALFGMATLDKAVEAPLHTYMYVYKYT